MASTLVVSLDLELMWGMRDIATVHQYGANVLGVRKAIPGMLAEFDRAGIRATWATVGMVFARSKEELLHYAPENRPKYVNEKLSSYSYIHEVGRSEREDPYYLGGSLVDLISQCPGQEIGSHTFSHYYCREPGQTVGQFDADIESAIRIANDRGIELTSFVFPRNQWTSETLGILRSRGFHTYRGNEPVWLYRSGSAPGQSLGRRAARLVDSYVNISGRHAYPPPMPENGLANVAASRFLRPYSNRLQSLDGLRLARIVNAMKYAARNGLVYHLWWHPHNFGVDLDRNIEFLRSVLSFYSEMKSEYGMKSMCMGDFLDSNVGFVRREHQDCL